MRYEAGATSILVTATANAPLVTLRTSATEKMRLRELGVTLQAATATRLGIARATTVSATPTGNFAGQNKAAGATAAAPLAASGCTLVTGWTTVPTMSANYLRRITLPAAIGAGFIWTWPADDPLEVGNGSVIQELCIANLVAVAPSLFDFYAVWED
jgi:hypothetical protein